MTETNEMTTFLNEFESQLTTLETILQNPVSKTDALAGRINALLHRLKHLPVIYQTVIVDSKAEDDKELNRKYDSNSSPIVYCVPYQKRK